MLTRRTLMKGALVAGAFAGGGLAGRLGGTANARAAMPLVARRSEALITDKGPTRGVMTYGEAEIPPVLRMRRGETFNLRLDNRLDQFAPAVAAMDEVKAERARDRHLGAASDRHAAAPCLLAHHRLQPHGLKASGGPDPRTNAKPSARLFVSRNMGTSADPVSNPEVLGIWYRASQSTWTVFHETGNTMFQGVKFNVLVVE